MRKHFLILMLLTLLPFAAWAHDVVWTAGANPTIAYTGSAISAEDVAALMTVTSSNGDITCTYYGTSADAPNSSNNNKFNVRFYTNESNAASSTGTGGTTTVTDPGTYYARVSVRAQNGTSWWSGDPTYDTDRHVLTFKVAVKTNVEVSFFKYTKTYGEADPEAKNLPESAHNTPSGATWDDIKGYLKFERVDAGEHVGNYHYTVKQDGGEDVYNILINVVAATIDIQQANATITAENKSKTYGDADPEFTATATGLINNKTVQDDLTNIGLSFTRAEGETVAGGPYPITPASTSLDYKFTYVKGALTINQRPLTLKAATASKTYGEDDPEFALVSKEEQARNFAPGEDETTIGLDFTRAAGETVPGSPYTITPAATIAAAAANYAITVNTADFTINKAPLNVTIDDKSKIYGESDPTFTLTPDAATPFYFTDDISVVTPNLTREQAGTIPGRNVGTYKITGTPTAANYAISFKDDVDFGTLTINPFKEDLTIDAFDKIYGNPDPEFAFVTAPTYQYSSDNATTIGLEFSREMVGEVKDYEKVGSYKISASWTSPNYAFTITNPDNKNLTINKRNATLTADNKSKTYGQADEDPTVPRKFTAVSSYVAPWDTDLDESFTFTREKAGEEGGENVGTYAITPASSNTNYNFTPFDGTLTIGQKYLKLKAVDKSKVYGQPDPLFETTVLDGGYENGDDFAKIGGSFIREKLGLAEGELVGPYVIEPTANKAGNYDIKFENGTLEITKATATLTADEQTKVYGADDPKLTVVVKGLTNGDTPKSIGATATRADGKDVGEYDITPDANDYFKANYVVDENTFVKNTLTITPKAITVTAEDKNKVYGAEDPAKFTATAKGLQFTDQVSDLGLTIERAKGENVGHYAITPSAGTNTNYTYSYVNGDFEITKAELTLTANNAEKTYGKLDSEVEFTATATGLVNGDTEKGVGLTVTRDNADVEDAGTYEKVLTPSAPGAAANYNVVVVKKGDFKINKATLVLTAADADKTYGQADPVKFELANQPEYQNGDDAESIGLTITRTNASVNVVNTDGDGNVLPYENVLVPAATSENYTYEISNGNFTINKKDATLTAENKSKTYGNADPTFTAVAEGLVPGDDLTNIGLSFARVAGENVGEYEITASSTSTNYNWLPVNPGILTIEKRGLLYALSNKEVEYNGKAVTTEGVYTLSSGSFADGESLAGLGISFDFFDEIKNAGTYNVDKLNVDYNENGNYDINFTGAASVKVNQKPFTEYMITNFDTPKTYTGFAQNPKIAVADMVDEANIIAESDYEVTIAKAGAKIEDEDVVEAGKYIYTFTPTAEGNYKGDAVAKEFVIGGMDISEAWFEEPWVAEVTYNGKAQPAEFTLSYVNDDEETVTLKKDADFTVDITVGEDAATEVKNADVYTYTFKGIGNYSGQFEKTYTINKADLTLDDEHFVAPAAVEGLKYSAAKLTLITAGSVTVDTEDTDVKVLYSLDNENFTEDLPKAKAAGNYPVYYMVQGGLNYNDVPAASVDATIAKRVVIVTAESVERVYDGTTGLGALEPEVIYSGLQGEDKAEDVVVLQEGQEMFNGAVKYAKNYGVYNIGVNTGAMSADNYEFAEAETQGTLTIKKANLTLTLNDRDEDGNYLIFKKYGEADPAFEDFLVIEGAAPADVDGNKGIKANITISNSSDKNVGKYDDVLTIKRGNAAVFNNYNVDATFKGDFEIVKNTVTIALKADLEKVYDGAVPTLNELTAADFVVTSLVPGDDMSQFSVLPTATIVDATKNVGVYTITLDGAEAKNYEISYLDARYTITPRELTNLFVQTQVVRVGDNIDDDINHTLWQVEGIQDGDDKDAIFELVVADGLYGEDRKINAAADTYLEGLVLVKKDADAAANYSGYDFVTGNLTVIDETGGTAIVLFDDQEQFDNLLAADGKELDVTVVVNRNQAIGKYDGKWHADQWNTMVLPFDVTPKELSNAFGYAIVNLVDPSRTTEGNVRFKLNLTEKIPANTPFTIRTDEDIEGGILFENKTIVAPTSAQVSVDAGCGYSFVGVYNTFTIDNTHPDYHFLVNGGWKVITSSNTYDIVPFNCYVDQSAVSSVRPEDVTFTFEDENGNVTAIKTVNVDAEGMFAEGWYTLEGKKLNAAPAQKGVYIHNGKKTVIK